jgi:hypothetical protein
MSPILSLDPLPAVELVFAGWPITLVVVGLLLVALGALLLSGSRQRRARTVARRIGARLPIRPRGAAEVLGSSSR